jgi:hypothetical protein
MENMREMVNAYQIVIGKSEKPGRCRHRQDSNIKIDLKGIGCKGVETGSG